MLELSSLSLDTLSLTPRDMGSGVFPSRSVEVCRVGCRAILSSSCRVPVELARVECVRRRVELREGQVGPSRRRSEGR